jgi:hypothetical protein
MLTSIRPAVHQGKGAKVLGADHGEDMAMVTVIAQIEVDAVDAAGMMTTMMSGK